MKTATKVARSFALSFAAFVLAGFVLAGALARAEVRAEGAPARGGLLHELAAEVAARLEAARVAHVVKPAAVAPVVSVKWKPIRLTPSLELGAPLVALAAGDLDGDGKAELYAVTTREVIALAVADHHVKELARVAFAGEPAMPAPRDPVGAAVIEGRVLIASSSAFARGVKVSWKAKQLVGEPGEPGIELCAGERVPLVAGRNYFGDDKTGYYGVRCRELVDPGTPGAGPAGSASPAAVLRLRGQLGLLGKLEVALSRCDGASCVRAADYTLAKAGTAFELADLERDGRPEVVIAGANAPGEPDELRVVTLGDDERKTKLKKAFAAGGIAGVAVGDYEGVPVVIAAVRLVGSTRVDLWRMN